jgi:hydrogenase maturation protease
VKKESGWQAETAIASIQSINSTAKNVLVIGVGNEFRGDDAAGLLVARQLRLQNLPGVFVVERRGEGADLITIWDGYNQVFLIDAVQSGSDPGTIYRFDVHKKKLPTGSFHFSCHAFGVVEAIEIARSLGILPPSLVVFAIEGHHYNFGSHLSSAVQDGLEQVIHMIRNEIDQISGN